MDEVQVEVWSSQVKLGQISRLVFSNKIGVYLIQFFNGEFTGGIFIFVDGLELQKIAIKNFVICSFRVFFCGLTQKLAWV